MSGTSLRAIAETHRATIAEIHAHSRARPLGSGPIYPGRIEEGDALSRDKLFRPVGCLPIISIIGLCMCAGIAFLVPASIPVLGDLRVRCSVGVIGTSATLTVTGLLAGRECRALVDGLSGIVGELTFLDVSPSGSVVCAYTLGLRRVTIRDEGALKIVGNTLCATLGLASL